MKKILLLAGLCGLCGLTALIETPLRAQTNGTVITITSTNASGGTTTVTLPIGQVEAALGLPPNAIAQLPAFDPGGLDFTNVNYKIGTGMQYLSSGGVGSYIDGDWDFYHGSSFDVGLAGNVTLSGVSSGFQRAAVDFELLKNFSNFQIALQAGAGGVFEGTRNVYGEESLEINYNLAAGTGLTFLGGGSNSKVFTYVFGKVTIAEDGFTDGNMNIEKDFEAGLGIAF